MNQVCERRPEISAKFGVRLEYVNHRGERALRRVVPAYLWWGETEYHPGKQWLLHVWDEDKQAPRDYAWNGIVGPDGVRDDLVTRVVIADDERRTGANVDAAFRALSFHDWLQVHGLIEAAREFVDLGLCNAANWMPKDPRRKVRVGATTWTVLCEFTGMDGVARVVAETCTPKGFMHIFRAEELRR